MRFAVDFGFAVSKEFRQPISFTPCRNHLAWLVLHCYGKPVSIETQKDIEQGVNGNVSMTADMSNELRRALIGLLAIFGNQSHQID